MARRGAGWTLGEQSGAGRGHRRKRAVKRLDVVDIPSPATRQMTWGWRAGPGQPSVEATRQEDVLRFEGPDFGIQRIHQRKCRIEGLDPLRRCAYARVQEPSARGSARGRPSLEEPSARGSARGRPSLEELLCKVAPVLVWLPQRNPAQRIAAGETCLLHTQRRWCRQRSPVVGSVSLWLVQCLAPSSGGRASLGGGRPALHRAARRVGSCHATAGRRVLPTGQSPEIVMR